MKTKLLTIKEAADLLKVCPDTLRRWEKQGLITPKRTKGNQRRYCLTCIKRSKIHEKFPET